MVGEVNFLEASEKGDTGVERRSRGGSGEVGVEGVEGVDVMGGPGEVGVEGMEGVDVIVDWELTEVEELPKVLSQEEMEVDSFSFESEDEEEKSTGETRTEAQPVLSRAFDIKVLQTAIEASTEALDLVVGKDVVMVAGKTGVGKSTLIQAIAGKRILAIEHTTAFSGELASKTVYEAEDALPAFEIGHTKESKTRSLNALLRGSTDIVYLDTPGVEDTGGVEMDIVTSSLLSQVAKRCKSLKFVILVHCASLLEDRGGAFRAVLKFVRTFVQDFSQSKSSFMFLFTHTNEITGMSKSLDDAIKYLEEEIILTVEGTKDDDVLMVLDFIRKSLKKNYPFVQIFHPVKTDVHSMIAFIEKRMKKVTDLALASTCNLTLPSKLKLEGAVQSLVQSLRVSLRESSEDLSQVKDIENRLEYLSNYIEVDCVRHAASECKEIIDEHIEILTSSIKDLVLRGTSSDLEFNYVHIDKLQGALFQLEELGVPGGAKHHLEIIKLSMQKFQDEILAKVRSLDPFHKELKKAFIWSEGFEIFNPIHAVLREKITGYIQGLLNALSNFNIPGLDTASCEEVGIFVYHLYKIHAMCEQLAHLPAADVGADDAVLAKDYAMQELINVLKSWSLNAEKVVMSMSYVDYEDDLNTIASRVRVLDCIQASIQETLKDHKRSFPCLEEQVIRTKKSLEDEVVDRFYQCCTKLQDGAFDPSWKPHLFWMQAVCSRFIDMQSDSWKRIQSSFFSLVDAAKLFLYKASAELETVSNMASTHGITNGKSLADELISLESCTWFDMILLPDQKFVLKCCERVRKVIDTRIQKKHMELESGNLELSLNSSKVIKEISSMFPELQEIDIYSSIANNAEGIEGCENNLTAKFTLHLENYAGGLSVLANKCIKHWTLNIWNGRIGYQRSMSRKLNYILADVEALLSTDAPGSMLKNSRKIHTVFLDAFAKFKEAVKKEFSSFEGMFDNKVAFLVCLKGCSGFCHVESQLVDFKKLQHHVRDLVSKEATKLEKMIESTTDWDQIDKCLSTFTTAKVLDPYVSKEVSTRLRTLKRLHKKREGQVDDVIQGMILNHNFNGIGELLGSLAQSEDLVKQLSFQHYQNEICCILEGLINEIHRLLDDNLALGTNSKKVAENMDVLVAARRELGDILSSSINLSYEMPQLYRKINTTFRRFTKEIMEAMKNKDFVQMVLRRRQACMFLSNMQNHLSHHNINAFRRTKDKEKVEMKFIPQHVDEFFSTKFEGGDNLFKVMSSLKQATEMKSFPILAELYENMKKNIASTSYDEMMHVRTTAAEYKCYDDMIIYVHSLHRHIQGSLREHCSNALVSACEDLIEDLREQKKENDRLLEFGGQDYEQSIERLSRQLNRLSSTRHWKYWSDDSKTYVNYCNFLLEKVERRFNQAQVALNSRDLVSVQEKIEFLEFLEHRKVQRHVAAVGDRLEAICDLCINAFLELCEKAKQILDSGSRTSFQEIFADYRGFVINVPCVLRSSRGQKQFALVNQLLYESLEQQVSALYQMTNLEAFDSSCLRSQVLHTREWGNFFADRLTLLHEEIIVHTKAQPDKWLRNIHKLCWEHFNYGRDLSKIKYCAILSIPPSASESDINEAINKAYRHKSRYFHQDKLGSHNDNGIMSRGIKEAHEKLLSMNHLTRSTQTQPFDEILIRVGEKLRDQAKAFMLEQRYDMAEKLLFELPNVKILDDLMIPKLDSDKISSSIYSLIKGHVDKIKIEVDSNWSARNYKDLNTIITDLKNMERHLKAYPQVFLESWDTGISRTIEAEINSLGQEASACLQSHVLAKQKKQDFRRCFINMGFVLVELPSFNAFTKSVMSCVLEECLDCEWGYSYLFELGLSLQKGDESSSDNENHVAQTIVAEFSYFKEVMTLIWNQEVPQKPADDVVRLIEGEHYISPILANSLDSDSKQLLESFASYEREYKSLLGDYIKPEADLNVLVHKTLALAKKVAPSHNDDTWGEDLKQKIPTILAGVFSTFTVLKSGASYNRIEAAAGSSDLGEKLLMKPHNIQVLTLLFMLGCGQKGQTSLESLLMQIRTGEGKSMILGGAATVLALLGFRVRTVCYSEYLSNRDYKLFKELFSQFGLTDSIKYSKITKFAEDSTAVKGDIRNLTRRLLRGTLSAVHETLGDTTTVQTNPHHDKKGTDEVNLCVDKRREILLVDEVDVFFGSEFYGQTYNQVAKFREPEIEQILKRIWNAWGHGRRLKLSDIKSMPEYKRLLKKMLSFSFVLDNEILLMLNQVSHVDDVPYYFDPVKDRIGYKVMDSISYNVTYGYATVFAYLKEQLKLNNKGTLSKFLAMPVSCGQFSYANISPYRILGVSGTLQAMGKYEREILLKYGLNKFIYVPSVYGKPKFHFDKTKTGEGIYFESNESDFFHRISAEITTIIRSKRAVIVFFRDRAKLNEFVASPTYRQLGRHKLLLTEDMNMTDKSYVINKAATAGQVTFSTAVFGRGTDFFCKDEVVESNRGVHVIQTFLSDELSEEIQIQGRTARQGKRGSYQMVLLESDLQSDFGVSPAEKDKVGKEDWYNWLYSVRVQKYQKQCKLVEENLREATEKDNATHKYFDSLLACNSIEARKEFETLYCSIKEPPTPSSLTLDLAFAIDVTGSMAPFSKSLVATIESLISGQNSILDKLRSKFPDIEFKMRVGCLIFRDIDDKQDQFQDRIWGNGDHFTDDVDSALQYIKSACQSTSGGLDFAEDHIGAIHHCAKNWNHTNDWVSDIKYLMLFSDAPTHGLVVPSFSGASFYDSYPTRHPDGLTLYDAISSLLSKNIDLVFCSFDPIATARTEEELSQSMKDHPENKSECCVIQIPMVPKGQLKTSASSFHWRGRHIIFVLDESSSMKRSWCGVVDAYSKYVEKRKQSQSYSDLVSIIQFTCQSRITVNKKSLSEAPNHLSRDGKGTCFYPAALDACKLARDTLHPHTPIIVFMSDGHAEDAARAAEEFSKLNSYVFQMAGNNLELHVIGFGSRANLTQLRQIAITSPFGKIHSSANIADVATVFLSIATKQDVATLVESEIAKRISEVVSDKLSLEYFRS